MDANESAALPPEANPAPVNPEDTLTPAAPPLDAVVLTDLHLGCARARRRAAARLLDRVVAGDLPTRRLVLGGDTIDSWDLTRLRACDFRVLRLLRRLAAGGVEVVWVRGNHEGDNCARAAAILGVPVLPRYEFASGPERVLVLHGDRRSVPAGACGVKPLKRGVRRLLAGQHDHGSAHDLDEAVRVCRLAVAAARFAGCTQVVAGHAHAPAWGVVEGVGYANPGAWLQPPGRYVAVAGGRLRLCAAD